MKQWLWQLVARIASWPAVANWLIARAQRTPYSHLTGYMNRWWLFNGFEQPRYIKWLPSIRIHQILRRDIGRHLHDHPWNARTIILRGSYLETRLVDEGPVRVERQFTRRVGDTATLNYGEYHRIEELQDDAPVWTMFITWKYVATWGFLVDGVKVPHRQYDEKRYG